MGKRRQIQTVQSKNCDVNNSIFPEVQTIIRKQLAFSSYPIIFEGLSEQKRLLKEVLTRTVLFGENNSVLLVGTRGCGKTALLNKVKEELYGLPDFSTNCVIIDLNGLVHTDDRIALKSIIHQLQLENSVGDKVYVSFADTFTFIMETLKCGSQECKTIMFILDEFDLFCHHKNQTLLYNIFDVVQSAHIPIAVVGLTCRVDVMELLEKRVKSRFSHRILYFFIKLSFESYINIAINLLHLPEEHFLHDEFREHWNAHIKELFDDQMVRNILQRLYDTSHDIRALKKFLLFPVSAVNKSHKSIEPSDFIDSQSIQILDSRAAVLQDLSILEFCLIIVMVHLNSLHDGEPLNYEIIYNEFRQNVQKKASLQQFSKAATMKAFDHLLSLELVKVIDESVINSQKNFQIVQLLLDPSQVKEALQRYPNLPTELQHWASRAFS